MPALRHGTELQERLLSASRPASPTHAGRGVAAADDTQPLPNVQPRWLGDEYLGLDVTVDGVSQLEDPILVYWNRILEPVKDGPESLRAWMRALGLWQQRSLLEDALDRRRASLHMVSDARETTTEVEWTQARLRWRWPLFVVALGLAEPLAQVLVNTGDMARTTTVMGYHPPKFVAVDLVASVF